MENPYWPVLVAGASKLAETATNPGSYVGELYAAGSDLVDNLVDVAQNMSNDAGALCALSAGLAVITSVVACSYLQDRYLSPPKQD